MKYYTIIAILGLFATCKAPKALLEVPLTDNQSILILDSLAASTEIIQDNMDGFFDNISLLDMSIQMKKNFPANTSQNEAVTQYKAFIQTDVADFTASEKAYVTKTFKEAIALCNGIAGDIFPAQIKLIKTKANHYGEQVYYTRQNQIVIPYDALAMRNEKGFLRVMLHEIFHIYSRYNPEKRDKLYELIGFSPIRQMFTMNEALSRRILLNPDGVNYLFKIDLKQADGSTKSAVPIIVSKFDDFDKTRSNFFNYLEFQLFEIADQPNNSVSIISTEKGFSTLNMRTQTDFFAQIKDNTNYIIHPDEIMADNFMFLMMSQKGGDEVAGFSEEGKALIKEIKKILVE